MYPSGGHIAFLIKEVPVVVNLLPFILRIRTVIILHPPTLTILLPVSLIRSLLGLTVLIHYELRATTIGRVSSAIGRSASTAASSMRATRRRACIFTLWLYDTFLSGIIQGKIGKERIGMTIAKLYRRMVNNFILSVNPHVFLVKCCFSNSSNCRWNGNSSYRGTWNQFFLTADRSISTS